MVSATCDGQRGWVPARRDVCRLGRVQARAGVAVAHLDGVEAGQGDEQPATVGGEGERVGVRAHLSTVERGHALVADGLGGEVDDRDLVVVGVGHEELAAVTAELDGGGVMADLHVVDLLARGEVDDRDRAAAGTAAAGLVGPVGDVQELVRTQGGRLVEGEAVGVEADRDGGDPLVAGRVDDLHLRAGGLPARTPTGRRRLAEAPRDVERRAVEHRVAGIAAGVDAVAHREVVGRAGRRA